MAYQLDPASSTAEEIRRVAGEQLDGAIADLTDAGAGGPDASSVHDARKRLKKTRSLVRLARADLGVTFSRQLNAELRDAGQALSAQRDADVMVQTAQRLLDSTADPRAIEALTLTKEKLAVESGREKPAPSPQPSSPSDGPDPGATQAPGSPPPAVIAEQLIATRDRLVCRQPKASGWKVLEAGLRRQYQAGRQTLSGLDDGAVDEEWHDWRKRAKDLWYHLRLLQGVWPEVMEPLSDQASHLADLLGDDHDLSVLADRMAADPPAVQQPGAVRELISAEQAKLRLEARGLGARLYADDPAAWTARLGTWWKLARRERSATNP